MLERQEMIDILEEIARNPKCGAIARIQAIKLLTAWERESPDGGPEFDKLDASFAELYAVEEWGHCSDLNSAPCGGLLPMRGLMWFER